MGSTLGVAESESDPLGGVGRRMEGQIADMGKSKTKIETELIHFMSMGLLFHHIKDYSFGDLEALCCPGVEHLCCRAAAFQPSNLPFCWGRSVCVCV